MRFFDTETHLTQYETYCVSDIANGTWNIRYVSSLYILIEHLVIELHLMERKVDIFEMEYSVPQRTYQLLLYPVNLLKSSQFNFAAVCHIVTFLSRSL